MQSMTIRQPDDLMIWLAKQAKLSHRSRNKQIQHILERAMKDANTPRYKLGVAQLCASGTHLFVSYNPAMSDFCNCGMFMFGEVR